jgi:Alpha galactosidase A/Transposase
VLCELARTDHHRFRVLEPDTDATKALRAFTRAREDLVQARAALGNQLRGELERFWPGPVGLFSDLDSPISLAFLALPKPDRREYIHARGLLAGIYIDAGPSTDQAFGSYGHYQQDADTFAAWGFDALKADFVSGGPAGLEPRVVFPQFASAVTNEASGRPMLFNVCNFWTPGQIDGTRPSAADSSYCDYQWAPKIAQSWRTDTDIGLDQKTTWQWIMRNFDHNCAHPEAAGPGHWNDPTTSSRPRT